MNPMVRRNRIGGSIVLTLFVTGALIGCESLSVKDDLEPQNHPLTEFTRELVVAGVSDARLGIDPRNRVIDRFGLEGDEAQQWYNILDHRRARKSDTTLEEFLDLHENLDAKERRRIEEVFAIALTSSSPEDLDARLTAYRASLGVTADESSAIEAYVAIFRGLAHGYRDLQRTAIAASIHETRDVRSRGGFIRLAQHQSDTDGRFDYPPQLIDSWQEFAQGTVTSGFAGGAMGAAIGAGICSPSTLFTAGVGPVVCVLGLGFAGFLIGSGLYAGTSLVMAELDYDGAIALWCKRQSNYIVKNEKYDTLCDENGQPRLD